MRITRIILAGMLLTLAACGAPVPTTPTPEPTPPTTAPPITPPTPEPAPPTTTPPITPPPTPPPATPPATPPPATPPAVRDPYEVRVLGREFTPSVLTVPVGTKVTWASSDGEQHDVKISATDLTLGDLPPFGSFSFTFTVRGTYDYYCSPHPEMLGRIVVE